MWRASTLREPIRRRSAACCRAASAIACIWPSHSRKAGNVLLLDEPTNDIDVNTLRALEEGLENFAGCAVVISHDRWFLDRIATHILSFEGDSKVVFYQGSYSEFEEWKRAQGGDTTPHRVKYKKLME